MMRKLILVMMTIACMMCMLVMPAWADVQQSTKKEPDAELQYTYVERILQLLEERLNAL